MPDIKLDEIYEKVAVELVDARIRVRALLELLEEKKLFEPGDFEQRAGKLWESDFNQLFEELTTPIPVEAQVAEEYPPTPPKPMDSSEYAVAMMHNLVQEAVGARIRLRAILSILEDKGLFAKGEFDDRAEQVWQRDYEEMALEFYKKYPF